MQSIIIIKFILLGTDQFQVLPEGLIGVKAMDVYHGSYFGFNSLPKNAAEPWMYINIAVLEKTHTQQPQGRSSHPTNQQNGNSRAVNSQNSDPGAVPEGTMGKKRTDSGKDIWVPTAPSSCHHETWLGVDLGPKENPHLCPLCSPKRNPPLVVPFV